MSDFGDYLKKVHEDLKILSEDIAKITVEKQKEAATKEPAKKEISTGKEDAAAKFKKISLKSLQPVTKLYKNEDEIKQAKANPEVDFVAKRLEDIFKG